MKITRMKRTEVSELSAEQHQAELKAMEAVKAKLTIEFELSAAEKKLVEKKKRPCVIKRSEVLVVE